MKKFAAAFFAEGDEIDLRFFNASDEYDAACKMIDEKGLLDAYGEFLRGRMDEEEQERGDEPGDGSMEELQHFMEEQECWLTVKEVEQ
jgi:hypothetical protein